MKTSVQTITRLLFGLILLMAAAGTVRSQQYPIYSQYIFNGLVLNPAYAGSHVQFSATAMYRNQWVNFDGAPKTLTFSAHTALFNGRVGTGLLITDDQIGSYSNKNIYGSYSYIIKTPAGKLAMGLQAGMNILSADFSALNLDSPDDPSFANFNNKIKPNFGAGLYFHNDLFFAGFSVPFLLNSGFEKAEIENAINEIRSARYYYLNGGVTIPLNRMKSVQLVPSLLIRAQEGSPLSLDINAGVIFYELLSVGASYRNIDAIVTYI
ncbi:type IX secretion system membrane protein PorP/SprF, partial [Fulvivirga sp. RKSG066]|uniref:PorP/SprF family type IX secretion system membrane protein n=1 Tax=Fulvivirga aurantia TaxID=2529383 RepID=UPI0012BB6EF7